MDNKKIFDYVFREELRLALVDGGFDEKQAQEIVSNRYKIAVKEGTIAILKKVISLIEQDKYEELRKMLRDSPSGDGYGMDNVYVDFSELDQTSYQSRWDKKVYDIGDVVNILSSTSIEE